uniref:RRM domain-containing protein n=1 Tax=Ananas comosus var. bracteatus TaxID=296719 RepID=A0A6V7PD04_ANACO|nr:unnamed protein product [Ananas comosus var. bracteatus]
MPRYDDRYGNTRLYVGRISSRTRTRDLEHLFSRYGRVREVDLKHDFAFVEFSDPRDADDARYSLDGREFDGSRITVEFARGGPRGRGGSREYLGRGPPPDLAAVLIKGTVRIALETSDVREAIRDRHPLNVVGAAAGAIAEAGATARPDHRGDTVGDQGAKVTAGAPHRPGERPQPHSRWQ